jgi:tRNA U34 5-methylaminomethyl-2-thiouridine-forming methyltransferase MnmC
MFEIFKTKDGSDSLLSKEFNETYHSSFGAIQESKHIFLEAGFLHCNKSKISVLEVGFGTGLNALLTYIYAQKFNKIVKYEAIELYPISTDKVTLLNYPQLLNISKEIFTQIHNIQHNIKNIISTNFEFKLMVDNHINYNYEAKFDVIYYDAFSPEKQPEMWTKEVLEKMYNCLNENGIFVTYVSKGEIRRNLIDIGFKVEKLNGPEGKRHILRALK